MLVLYINVLVLFDNAHLVVIKFSEFELWLNLFELI